MRYFAYIEPKNPPEDMEAVYITLSEKEIIDQYYPYWSEQMIKKYGIEEFETKWSVQDCIDDFVVIHWAVERKGYEMTDKELLELAAKAAGIEYGWQHIFDDYDGCTADTWDWNPLADDGDALRLAVKLELTLGIPFDHTIAMVWTNDISNFIGNAEKEGGIYAATRRAIVRAAAAIGKGMK